MERMFFVTFEDGMWLVKSHGQYIGSYENRAEAIEFAIHKADLAGYSTQVLVAGEDRLFQTVWAGGKASYSSVH